MTLRFEWEPQKAYVNEKKHGVTFQEAASVFLDPFAIIFDDDAHSITEVREIIIGQSIKNRLLIVCYTERDDDIRIISARSATRSEHQSYEDNSIMKEPAPDYQTNSVDDMLDEYQFDYSKAKPNRFANRFKGLEVMVVLDHEVAEVFTTSEAVNDALRSLIEATSTSQA